MSRIKNRAPEIESAQKNRDRDHDGVPRGEDPQLVKMIASHDVMTMKNGTGIDPVSSFSNHRVCASSPLICSARGE